MRFADDTWPAAESGAELVDPCGAREGEERFEGVKSNGRGPDGNQGRGRSRALQTILRLRRTNTRIRSMRRISEPERQDRSEQRRQFERQRSSAAGLPAALRRSRSIQLEERE